MLASQTSFRAMSSAILMVALLVSAASAQAQQPKSAPPSAQKTEPAQPPAAPATPKEVTLTEPQIQHVLEAQKDFGALLDKLPKTENAKPDPKIAAQFDEAAKAHGFASYADYNDAVFTISDILNGFDAKTKTYIGPEAVLKQQLTAVQADPKIPAKEKAAIVKEINDALRSPPPAAANKANVDLVTKLYDKIAASLQDE